MYSSFTTMRLTRIACNSTQHTLLSVRLTLQMEYRVRTASQVWDFVCTTDECKGTERIDLHNNQWRNDPDLIKKPKQCWFTECPNRSNDSCKVSKNGPVVKVKSFKCLIHPKKAQVISYSLFVADSPEKNTESLLGARESFSGLRSHSHVPCEPAS